MLIRVSRAPVFSLIQLCKCATLRVSSVLIPHLLIMQIIDYANLIVPMGLDRIAVVVAIKCRN